MKPMFKRLMISPVTHAVGFAAFIFALSSVPSPPVLGSLDLNDKMKHIALYAAFAGLIARAVAVRETGAWRIAIWTVALASLYGASDEFHQRFTPGRSCDILDWCADTLGAIAASVTIPPLIRQKQD